MSLKIVIPMAGFGTRMRPLTWSRPKQLLQIANQSMLAHVLDMLETLPDLSNSELIFITGYLGEQVGLYMRSHYPHLKVHYVQQSEMKGQSDAIYRARELLQGPMLMVFSDTIVGESLAFLGQEQAGAVAWAHRVQDPRRFGVARLDRDGWVSELVEKPQTMENKLAVVGFYYFSDSSDLLAAIEEQMRAGTQLNGEYYLADAVNIMLQRGLKMRLQMVDTWLDSGKPQAVLEMNRWLLENGRDNSAEVRPGNRVKLHPPVYVHPSAQLSNAVIGPHASIGAGCQVSDSSVANSIIEQQAIIQAAELNASLIGQRARIKGGRGSIIVGDDTVLNF